MSAWLWVPTGVGTAAIVLLFIWAQFSEGIVFRPASYVLSLPCQKEMEQDYQKALRELSPEDRWLLFLAVTKDLRPPGGTP